MVKKNCSDPFRQPISNNLTTMDTQNLIATAKKSLLNTAVRPEVVMQQGRGMYLFDTEGRQYLDFIGGWAVNCLGHCPPALVKIIETQSRTLINASPAFYNRPMIEYSEQLLSHCCFDRVFFTSTGAEANEGAIKLARKYGQLKKNGATEIITTWNSFHGRTLTTMSATGKKHWQELFGPKTAGFIKTTFNEIDSVKKSVNENTCAIMIEPIQGEGGVNIADREFIEGIRHLCDEHDILLIFDEIQTGMGRTGSLFCYEQYGIEPDIMALGKGIGGGYPLAAVLAKEQFDLFEPGDQGGTYTGQPLAMAVGKIVLKELLGRDLVANSSHMGALIMERLGASANQLGIERVRGKGLLIAFDLKDTDGSTLVNRCLEQGLIVNAPGPKTIRLMPPLIVSEKEIELFLEILSRCLAH
ncbi:MAG: aspartate aminotransferase family protein [Desulfocapsaceae bacterium]